MPLSVYIRASGLGGAVGEGIDTCSEWCNIGD